ncbi:hypothetical protein LTR50_001680 [Elasticomyces elasticus]|nr:hypothetical protein LTR50_001680 [Elasticomyces elasticus]
MRVEGSNIPPNDSQTNRPFSNGSSNGAISPRKNGSSPTTNGSTHSNSNGYTNGTREKPTEPFYGHDREEVTRILIQSLTDLGYDGAARTLSNESGYNLENRAVAKFRRAVLDGDWSEAERTLFGDHVDDTGGGVGLYSNESDITWLKSSRSSPRNSDFKGGLPLSEGANTTELRFWIRQQKYLELLEIRDRQRALQVLRQELQPLQYDETRLHALSSLIMCCEDPDNLRQAAQWDGAQGESRSQLLSELSQSISPSVMIPEHRLAHLLNQVRDNQIANCLYHNSTASPSLYVNHTCDRDDFPLETLTELRDHSDEVWYIDFSPDGSMLATACKDGSVFIYDTKNWSVSQRLLEHDEGACYVAWSPDSQHVITCSQGQDHSAYVWDAKTGHRILDFTQYTYAVTTAAWSPDGTAFVIGSQDAERPLNLYSLQSGQEIYAWAEAKHPDRPNNGFRIQDVAIAADGSRMVAITYDNRVFVYDWLTKQRISEWSMDNTLTCVSISSDGREVLINMNEGRLVLMDAVTGEPLMRYQGLRQTGYVIRSGFGGAGDGCIVSGSEDSHVYIWRRQSGILVEALEAHGPGYVNTVSWNRADPAMFASAGDDHRVRIWSNMTNIRAYSQQLGAVRGMNGIGPIGGNIYMQ